MAFVLKIRLTVCLCLVLRRRCVPLSSFFDFLLDCAGCPRWHTNFNPAHGLLSVPHESFIYQQHRWPCLSRQETPGAEGTPLPSRYPIQQNSRPVNLILTTCRDAWRYQGIFSTWERFRPKHSFPGLGLGVGLFAVYLAYDFAFGRPAHAAHPPANESSGGH